VTTISYYNETYKIPRRALLFDSSPPRVGGRLLRKKRLAKKAQKYREAMAVARVIVMEDFLRKMDREVDAMMLMPDPMISWRYSGTVYHYPVGKYCVVDPVPAPTPSP
jgi:hypothetical protein